MCEEFSCTPSEAERELERDMEQVLDVMAMRSYYHIHSTYKHAKKAADIPASVKESPMTRVYERNIKRRLGR